LWVRKQELVTALNRLAGVLAANCGLESFL